MSEKLCSAQHDNKAVETVMAGLAEQVESYWAQHYNPKDLATGSSPLVKGQKYYIVATSGIRKYGPGANDGRQARLSIVPEWVFNMTGKRQRKPADGFHTNVICEVVFDGDDFTVSQLLEGVVPQE
ncbi:MAG: hypothetical protein FP810_11390 [Desulfocapsa sp.]|nr:hypothetical protein [Desulfocapsa sp.]MBU3983269.1 hypothetical protein [Pseudomonadota bacterium]MBU4396212.1 hypothetical protein [Pseudomonadota bacterium]MCG2743208.1 hypothetical protein [Desulfobacteraceae bacterium]